MKREFGQYIIIDVLSIFLFSPLWELGEGRGKFWLLSHIPSNVPGTYFQNEKGSDLMENIFNILNYLSSAFGTLTP